MQANITTTIAITEGIRLLAMTPCGKTQTLAYNKKLSTSISLNLETEPQ